MNTSITSTGPVKRTKVSATAGWEDLVAATLALLVVSSVYADGWAHLNVPGLESFFTPWHAALYTSFAGLAGWVGWLGWRHGRSALPRLDAFPPGYGLAAAGIAVFAAGGVGDMLWHMAFGVEAGIDALLSPTHLMLLVGGVLLITAPLRSAADRGGAPRGAGALAVAVSLAATAALAMFFLSYQSVFVEAAATVPLTTIPEGEPGHLEAEMPVMVGLGSYLITSVAILVTILLARRLVPALPAGAVTVSVAAVALLSASLAEFEYGEAAVGAVVGAAFAEALTRSRALAGWVDEASLLGGALPVGMWAGQLIGLEFSHEVRWSVELWAGVILLSALVGVAVAAIALPSRRRSTAAT
ncbi:MAG: hypothetical protein GEU94_02620 [Micromonosporaceae bacterium]|nr:hypothetical protein [Micromonosporaceae bacterium]